MITVEQIRALEDRIEKALAFIAGLKAEIAELRSGLDRSVAERLEAEKRADEAALRVLELEEAAAAFRKDQQRIEEGIVHALGKLDAFEDLVLHREVTAESTPEPAPQSAPAPAARAATPAPATTEVRSASKAPVAPRPLPASAPARAEALDAQPVEEAPSKATQDQVAPAPPVDELDIF